MKRTKEPPIQNGDSPNSKKQKSEVKSDFFKEHFFVNLDDPVAEQLSAGANATKTLLKSDLFEDSSTTLHCTGTKIHCTDVTKRLSFDEFPHVPKIAEHFKEIHSDDLTKDQEDLYQAIGRYMDLCVVDSSKSYMPLLSFHSLNHVIKTRNIVLKNNEMLEKASKNGTLTDEMIESARDQGLSRPKVLFVTPMKKFAYDFVQNLMELYFPKGNKKTVMNHARFEEEFGDNGHVPHERKKPDFRELMSGNIDDCFRIGIQITKKAMKLYQKFIEADILVCSPLGMRMVIGDEEARSETDFLTSVEIVIVDRANIVMMQNWEHLMHLIETINCVPKKIETDISR
ncbi:hypothetical protein FO519_008467 [Halicephalobus sp. NKZ332]|nr:hypothetical protein FO519_008467 [Halicephalobus sp. NKZ332]